MNNLTLILGGARSGKSTFAVNLAKKFKRVAFIATSEAKDKEMAQRIKLHRKTRPENWKTFEEPRDPAALLSKITGSFDCVIIDCLTLLVSNLILAGNKPDKTLKRIETLVSVLRKNKAKTIIVSNEVGLGIVPASKLGRGFRDIAGRANQITQEAAKEVFFMISGLALKIKGGE